MGRAVLGIDAAWTSPRPSGVALAKETPQGWQLVAVESSYQRFVARGTEDMVTELHPSGSVPNPHALLQAGRAMCGIDVDMIAIDIPLSRKPIAGRRASDNAVSRAYGARKCGTHTPSIVRPGPISDELRKGFEDAGYPLQTVEITGRGLIEVYPHPALVELAGAAQRLKYKVAKSRQYWPTLTQVDRRSQLLRVWSQIVRLLDERIAGTASALGGFERRARGKEAKATEDMIDAIVCTWVAISALDGRARPYGDADSAIWIPTPNAT